MDKKGIVYAINCKQCDLKYVGQSGRMLDRVKEHINNIRQSENRQNSITQHRINEDHEMDFQQPEVLCNENNFRARTIMQSLHIKMCKVMNTMIENNKFTNVYDSMLAQY